MCMYFNSEDILTSILQFYSNSSEGISTEVIEKYCQNIKKIISTDYKYVFFENSENDLERIIKKHPKQFSKFMNRYYKGKEYNYNVLNICLPKISGLVDILEEAAKIIE